MNPSNSSSPKPMQDVTSPKTQLIEAEIEHGIPVKQPGQEHTPPPASAPTPNPIAPPKQFVDNSAAKDEADLDHILKDVNKSVKSADKDKKPRSKFALHKKDASKANASPKTSMPAMTVVAAVLVAGLLTTSAVYAFKQSALKPAASPPAAVNRVGTSDSSSDAVQAAGGSLVQPGDLSDLASSLQSKINAFNDTQDFNSADLSDQALGL